MKNYLAFASCVFLVSCAATYHEWNGTTGYRESKIAPDLWEIEYAEGSSNGITQAKYHAALRCSELAQERGSTTYKFTITGQESRIAEAAIGGSYISGLNGAMSVNEGSGMDNSQAGKSYRKKYSIPVITGNCEITPPGQTSP